jgi:hypothetical protein
LDDLDRAKRRERFRSEHGPSGAGRWAATGQTGMVANVPGASGRGAAGPGRRGRHSARCG